MHDRIKFELNLPSTARQYLDEFNEDYPNNSLPGYPTNQTLTTLESVVMPRMVYDIWPYYVPFYPLYSNILYPALNQCPSDQQQLKVLNETLNSLPNATSMTPNYFRQIKSNPASVNADCMNRSIVGSSLTPCELDKKIQQQIHHNQHLIAAPASKPI